MTTFRKIVLLTICVLNYEAIKYTYGYSIGAPASTCDTMMPGHGVAASTAELPYKIELSQNRYGTGDEIKMTLIPKTSSQRFSGYLFRVQSEDGVDVGSFVAESDGQEICTAGRTHFNNNPKFSQMFRWKAPSSLHGTLRCVVTVVEEIATFWVKQDMCTLLEDTRDNTSRSLGTNFNPTTLPSTSTENSTSQPPPAVTSITLEIEPTSPFTPTKDSSSMGHSIDSVTAETLNSTDFQQPNSPTSVVSKAFTVLLTALPGKTSASPTNVTEDSATSTSHQTSTITESTLSSSSIVTLRSQEAEAVSPINNYFSTMTTQLPESAEQTSLSTGAPSVSQESSSLNFTSTFFPNLTVFTPVITSLDVISSTQLIVSDLSDEIPATLLETPVILEASTTFTTMPSSEIVDSTSSLSSSIVTLRSREAGNLSSVNEFSTIATQHRESAKQTLISTDTLVVSKELSSDTLNLTETVLPIEGVINSTQSFFAEMSTPVLDTFVTLDASETFTTMPIVTTLATARDSPTSVQPATFIESQSLSSESQTICNTCSTLTITEIMLPSSSFRSRTTESLEPSLYKSILANTTTSPQELSGISSAISSDKTELTNLTVSQPFVTTLEPRDTSNVPISETVPVSGISKIIIKESIETMSTTLSIPISSEESTRSMTEFSDLITVSTPILSDSHIDISNSSLVTTMEITPSMFESQPLVKLLSNTQELLSSSIDYATIATTFHEFLTHTHTLTNTLMTSLDLPETTIYPPFTEIPLSSPIVSKKSVLDTQSSTVQFKILSELLPDSTKLTYDEASSIFESLKLSNSSTLKVEEDSFSKFTGKMSISVTEYLPSVGSQSDTGEATMQATDLAVSSLQSVIKDTPVITVGYLPTSTATPSGAPVLSGDAEAMESDTTATTLFYPESRESILNTTLSSEMAGASVSAWSLYPFNFTKKGVVHTIPQSLLVPTATKTNSSTTSFQASLTLHNTLLSTQINSVGSTTVFSTTILRTSVGDASETEEQILSTDSELSGIVKQRTSTLLMTPISSIGLNDVTTATAPPSVEPTSTTTITTTHSSITVTTPSSSPDANLTTTARYRPKTSEALGPVDKIVVSAVSAIFVLIFLIGAILFIGKHIKKSYFKDAERNFRLHSIYDRLSPASSSPKNLQYSEWYSYVNSACDNSMC